MLSYMKWGDIIDRYFINCSCDTFFLFGFYIMKKVDQFIYENEKRVNEEMKMREPSSVKISGDMSLIEIDREIDKFRQNHPNFEIILKEENNNLSK